MSLFISIQIARLCMSTPRILIVDDVVNTQHRVFWLCFGERSHTVRTACTCILMCHSSGSAEVNQVISSSKSAPISSLWADVRTEPPDGNCVETRPDRWDPGSEIQWSALTLFTRQFVESQVDVQYNCTRSCVLEYLLSVSKDRPPATTVRS